MGGVDDQIITIAALPYYCEADPILTKFKRVATQP